MAVKRGRKRAVKAEVVDSPVSASAGPERAGRPRPNRSFGPFFAPAKSKIRVDEWTALTSSAVFGSIRVITSRMKTLPMRVMRTLPSGDREHLVSHPVQRLLSMPNPEMTRARFMETLDSHRLSWGNGYAIIERDASYEAVALWPVLPDRVEIKRLEGTLELFYVVRDDEGKPHPVAAADMIHIRNFGYDGIKGYSPVRLAKEAIALGLAAEQFGAEFFGNGSHLAGVLETDEQLDEDDVKLGNAIFVDRLWSKEEGEGEE